MGWLITLGIIILLMVLPLGASVIYNADGFFAYVIAGPLRIKLFPISKKGNGTGKSGKEKQKADNAAKDNPKKTNRQGQKQNTSGGSITDFLPLLKTGIALLNDFRKKLRVNKLDVKIILSGGDPCDLAVNYGKAWAAVGNLMPQLERFLVIQKRNIQVECDFVSDNTLIFTHVDLTITLGRILYIAVYYGIRAICDYIKIMKKRKGGANK